MRRTPVKSDEAVASDASEERGESERREEREVELRRVRSVRGSRGMAGCIDAVVHVRVRAVMARITVAFPSEKSRYPRNTENNR